MGLPLCKREVHHAHMMPDWARVSTDGQSVEAQVAARTAAGRERRRPTVHVCAGWHSVSGWPDGSEAPACASRRTPAEYLTKRLTLCPRRLILNHMVELQP